MPGYWVEVITTTMYTSVFSLRCVVNGLLLISVHRENDVQCVSSTPEPSGATTGALQALTRGPAGAILCPIRTIESAQTGVKTVCRLLGCPLHFIAELRVPGSLAKRSAQVLIQDSVRVIRAPPSKTD